MGRSEKLKAMRREERQIDDKRTRKHRTTAILVVISLVLLVGIVVVVVRPSWNTSDDEAVDAENNGELAQEEVQEQENPADAKPLKEFVVDTERIKNRRAVIETPKGIIRVELLDKAAPKTVTNFIDLAESGFYNGTTFHRVEKGFVIQGGDPLSKDDESANDGTGGPDYRFDDEINPIVLGLSEQQIQTLQVKGYRFTADLPSEKNTVGTLSMANSGPSTNGSQFFIITESDQAHLDGKHTVFGRVIEGLDVARSVEAGDAMTVRMESDEAK